MATADFRVSEEVSRHRWIYLALAIGFVIWCWVDVIPRGVINRSRIGEHRTDFTVYTEAGAAFFDGRDPYQVSNPRGWRYLYPPLFAIMVAPLHVLPSTAQVAVWFVLSVAMLFGCFFELRRILIALSADAPTPINISSWTMTWIGIAALAAGLLPALNTMQRGQVEVFKLFLILYGFRLAVTATRVRGWFAAGVVLALAGILKLTPLLPVACLILFDLRAAWGQRTREHKWTMPASLAGGLGVGLCLFALVIPAALTGWNANLGHLETWFQKVVTKVVDVRTTDFGEDVRSIRNQSLDNAAYRLGNFLNYELCNGPNDALIDHPHDASLRLPMDNAASGLWIVGARVLALAALLLLIVRMQSKRDSLSRGAVFGLACVATLVVCPVSRACYFVLMFPAIVFVCVPMLQMGKPRTALFFAWFPVVCVWLHYLLLPDGGRVGLLGLGTTAWFLASCIVFDREAVRLRTAAPDSLRANPYLEGPRVPLIDKRRDVVGVLEAKEEALVSAR